MIQIENTAKRRPDAERPDGPSVEAEQRSRITGGDGGRAWRSTNELADTPAFRSWLEREFPRFASEWDQGVDRRRFLQLSGASLALAGLGACTKQPGETIVPYVRQPEWVVPGKPLFFATMATIGGMAQPVLAESHLGRPTKVEGNPEHPASLGATSHTTQASVLDLYDPDRLQAVMHLGQIRTWSTFVDFATNKMSALRALGGEGLRILTGTVTSPSQGAQLERLRAELPEARWHQFESACADGAHRAAVAAFGRPVSVRYDLSKADVVLALDADIFSDVGGGVRYSKDFSARRRQIDADHPASNRLYSVETAPTGTSILADHRLALAPAALGRFVAALASRLGVAGVAQPAGEVDQAWVDAVAGDLEAHAGTSAVVVGAYLDEDVQTLAHAINDRLGNLGQTVIVSDPVDAEAVDQAASLRELVADMEAGSVDTLIILGANPVYDAPADLDVVAALENVSLRICLTQRVDETALYCHWQLPEAHDLERWGDARAYDGTVTLQQPIIEPLYEGRSPQQVLAILLGESTVPADELLRGHHEALDDRAWRRALHDGFLVDSTLPALTLAVDSGAASAAAGRLASAPDTDMVLLFRPDPSVWDGRFANNAWLQECPKPLTKLTWDNALLMSARTARDLGLGDLVAGNDQGPKTPMVTVTVGDRSLEVPVWVLPGHADGAVTLHLGYGRTAAGRVGDGVGVDVGVLRTSSARWQTSEPVSIAATGEKVRLASTQDHHSMEGRDLIRVAKLADVEHDPEHAYAHHGHGIDPTKSLMDGKDFPYDGYAWGMSIDLNACTGCNACVIACQSENNIATVGKDQVMRGRELHWIRIDRYFVGEDADHVDAVVTQPVTCMHCEQAPCEVVCPVAATVHSDEGLNDMVYNRCVGTRYCSNNCPYKVRRFNFFLYSDFETPSLQLGRNPDVTVRSRGVMEKCTYCVQRINSARIEAKREQGTITDGAVKTACQQVCPADAIVFGDINDEASEVTKTKALPRNYDLLGDLGTRPRTSYLARVRNPNPLLEPQGEQANDQGGAHHG